MGWKFHKRKTKGPSSGLLNPATYPYTAVTVEVGLQGMLKPFEGILKG